MQPRSLFPLIILFVIPGAACTRNLETIPRNAATAATQTTATADSSDDIIIKLNIVEPFKNYLDSLSKLTLAVDSEYIQQYPINPSDPSDPQSYGTGQAEMGFAFRTSKPGYVFFLGIQLPTSGYQHTVTVWDSASGAAIARARIYNNSSSAWTYTNDFQFGLDTPLLANHGYILSFNSAADGEPINTNSPCNSVFYIYGIWDFKSNPPPIGIPMFPFTRRFVTVEGSYTAFYDTPIKHPIFPGNTYLNPQGAFTFLGNCDIGITLTPNGLP